MQRVTGRNVYPVIAAVDTGSVFWQYIERSANYLLKYGRKAAINDYIQGRYAMIIDTIRNCEKYYVFGENFKKAFEFLKSNDISKMELGRHEIDGDNVFILVQDYISKTIDNCGLESHKVYADVHYVKEGFEYLGYTPIERASAPITNYDPKADATFYEKECQFFLLQADDIAIVFPHDVHMPQKRALVGAHVRKACIKVKVS